MTRGARVRANARADAEETRARRRDEG